MTPTDNPVLGKYTAPARSFVIVRAEAEELRAAYQRIDELTDALTVARKQLITLGGDEAEGCQIQQAVLSVLNEALS